MSNRSIHTLLKNWDEECPLTREEAVEVLNLPEEEMDSLMECAYALRTEIEKYKRVSDEKLYGDNDLVDEKHLARHCIGLSGIGFSDEEIEDLADRIREMKKKDTQICCSIGFLTEKQARILKDAGLDRINHNLNSSRSFYPEICTTHTYDQRVNNIKMLQSLGFEICSGGIVGMGESKEDIVDMLMDLREINPESVPINFLLPIPGTRLADRDISELTPEYCLKVLCLARPISAVQQEEKFISRDWNRNFSKLLILSLHQVI